MSIQQLLNTKQFKKALAASERAIYLGALAHCGGNQAATARVLGVARGTVIAKLRQYQSEDCWE